MITMSHTRTVKSVGAIISMAFELVRVGTSWYEFWIGVLDWDWELICAKMDSNKSLNGRFFVPENYVILWHFCARKLRIFLLQGL